MQKYVKAGLYLASLLSVPALTACGDVNPAPSAQTGSSVISKLEKIGRIKTSFTKTSMIDGGSCRGGGGGTN